MLLISPSLDSLALIQRLLETEIHGCFPLIYLFQKHTHDSIKFPLQDLITFTNYTSHLNINENYDLQYLVV